MASVQISGVRKYYGAMEVLHGVDLSIADGEFVVLVGPSGCGKSTLLRMVAGLEGISDGEIRIDGTVVNDLPPKARDTAMIFQNYALYPHMNVRDNMGFSLKLAGASKAEIDAAVRPAAEILGLTPLLDRRPKELSGGQRQRVAMGRAMVRKPRVFLFDEPLSNLDAKLRVAMRAEIKQLHRRLGTTILYVTHDQVEAMTMADKVVVMHDGQIEQIGEPLELYDGPANMFVAGFIGSPAMNLVPGTIRHARNLVETADGLSLPVSHGTATVDGQPVLYGIRPEHLQLAAEGILGQVELVEPAGSETQTRLRVGSQSMVVVRRGRPEARVGDYIHLVPDLSRVHLFDPQSGRRLD